MAYSLGLERNISLIKIIEKKLAHSGIPLPILIEIQLLCKSDFIGIHTKSIAKRKIDDINLFSVHFGSLIFFSFLQSFARLDTKMNCLISPRYLVVCTFTVTMAVFFYVEASIRFDYLFYPRLCCISQVFSLASRLIFLLAEWCSFFETNGSFGCDEPISLHHGEAGQCT